MNKLLVSISLSLGVLTPAALTQSSCFEPAGPVLVADAMSFGDTIYPAQPIGFAFPFNGTTYTDIHLSDHLFAFLSNGGVPTVPAGGALTYNVQLTDFIGYGPCLSPFWSDTTMGTAGTLTVSSTPTQFTATWTDVETYFAVPPAFSVQLILFPSGEIRFLYNAQVNNYGSSFAPNAIVGVTPGAPAVLPAASDLSSVVTTSDPTVFENFATPSTFDLANNGLQFLPTNPGWVVVPLGAPTGCADVFAYGTGCINEYASFYEEFANAGSFDLANSALTLFNTGSGYAVTAAGSYNAVGSLGTPTTVPLSDDSEAAVGTLGLSVGSNGWVAIGTGNSVAFVPDVPTFLGNPQTAFYCWHDYNPAAAGSGTVQYEQSGTMAQVTFNGVYDYATTSPNFLQFQINTATGDVVIAWQSMSTAGGTGFLVGYSPGGANLDPGSTDISATTLIQTFGTDIEPLTLSANAPRLGSMWTLTTSRIDPVSPVAITFYGTAQIPGGLPLTSIGINSPGCFAWIQPLITNQTSLSVGGTALGGFTLPATPSLAGGVLTAQSVALSLAVPSNLLTSNGIQGTLGN